jgi:hypothetical protein
LFSNTLPSTSTRFAFLSSKRFLTTHRVRAAERLVEVVATDLDVRRDEAAMVGSPPPNMMFSPEPSRKLFTILNGPGPFQPMIACDSPSDEWHSER